MILIGLAVVAAVFLLTDRRYRWLYIFYKTIGRDLRALFKFVILNFYLQRYLKTNQTVAKIFTRLASEQPHKIAFHFEDEIWTFQELERYSNKVAHFFKSEGLKRGDSVALQLENCPEYVGIWLGLGKIGVVTALINNNLVADPLVHSITVSGAQAVIFGSALKKGIKDISSKIPSTKLYELTPKSQKTEALEGAVDLNSKLETQANSSPAGDIEKGTPKEKLLFIYTSGTTGLPKAAVITNMRFFFISLGLHYMTGLTKKDVVYDPLPLYHSAGGIVGAGQCVVRGLTVAMRKKFSASNFWSDCAKYECTAAQYIGEICRYLLIAHSKSFQVHDHRVTKMMGNGLRSQIWNDFIHKFNIKEVYEFYGATEGNSNLINIDSKPGAVGFVPRYATALYPVTLVKYDERTTEPIRGSNGFCQRCRPGEPGILLGIVDAKKTINEFSGYLNKEATQKKLMVNVFKKGDLFFNSGDVLVQDELGYFYFKDRTGDTFRWKGENVATTEIEAVISNVINLNDAAVYGVEVPGSEGRAGMVAVVDTSNSLDMEKLCKGLRENLPSYAIPLFVRVMTSVPLTGTFKLKKTELQSEGFDVEKIKDKLFLYDARGMTYVELTKEKYHDILEGKIRL